MSDLDDLRKLQQLYDEGRLTQEEYNREKAWILGSGNAAPVDAEPARSQRATSTGHILDLHEIEAQEAAAAAATAESTVQSAAHLSTAPHPDRSATPIGASGQADSASGSGRQYTSSDSGTSGRQQSRKRIPTVWKVILVAFLIWILLLATAVVYLRLRGTSAQNDVTAQSLQDTAGVQTQHGSAAAQNAAQEIRDSAEAGYDAFVSQLDTILGTYYGENYSISDDGKTLTISLMGDGIAADAMYVVQGADGAAEIWSELKDSMQTLAMTCFDGANAETPERHVVLNILNDQNQENVILSYLDGTCIYDATETSNLSE